ncbi:hypothetical protein JOM56_010867 [Amanita muscaria]
MSSSFDFNYESTFGALLIGFGLSCVIFGILSIQTFTYFQRYPSDLLAYKLLVASIWVIEVFDQVLIGHATYVYIISRYGDVVSVIATRILWSLVYQTIVGSFVGTVVKTCFALRVWRFSNHSIIITGIILILVFGTFGLAICYAYKCSQLTSILLVNDIKMYGTYALAAGVAADFVTSASLCFFLHRLRTGHKKSDSLVNRLTIYAVNTGGVTGAVSLTTLLLYNISPHTFYFMATFFCLGKVYALSLLCTLHTRKTIRGRGTDRGGNTTSKAGEVGGIFLVNHQPRSSFDVEEIPVKSMHIDVQQEVAVVSDADGSVV